MIAALLRMLAALCCVAAVPAAAEWREASSDHFLIYADASEEWTRAYAQKLERFDAAMRAVNAMPWDPDQRSNRLVIYVLDTPIEVARLQGDRSVAGFYIPRIGGSVAFTARARSGERGGLDPDTILFHEYAHHLMLANFAAIYPSWYVEGFAEFNSTAEIERDGSVMLGKAAKHRAYSLLGGDRLRIEHLFDRPAELPPELRSVFSGRAWVLTHILTFDAARNAQLKTYFGLLNRGVKTLDAARQAFGELGKLNEQIDIAIGRPFTNHRVAADRLTTGPIALRLLTPGEVATMPVRLRSKRGVDRAAATAPLPEARRLAAPFPNDAGAQEALAEAEFDAGNDAAAETAADRAIAADPKRVPALIYKGRAQVRRAVAAKATDPAVWNGARDWFRRATMADPNAAEPLMRFYQSFGAQGQPPTANAAAAMLRAFELSPQSGELRMLAARQMLADDRPAEARRALLPLAYDPHSTGGPNTAARLVELIDQGVPTKDIVRPRAKAVAP